MSDWISTTRQVLVTTATTIRPSNANSLLTLIQLRPHKRRSWHRNCSSRRDAWRDQKFGRHLIGRIFNWSKVKSIKYILIENQVCRYDNRPRYISITLLKGSLQWHLQIKVSLPWRDKKTHRINKLPASLNSMSFDFNRLRSLNLQEARDSKEVVLRSARLKKKHRH